MSRNRRHAYNRCVPATVLLIDDDVELCELLTRFLDGEGFAVHAVHSGAAGLVGGGTGASLPRRLPMVLTRANRIPMLRETLFRLLAVRLLLPRVAGEVRRTPT